MRKEVDLFVVGSRPSRLARVQSEEALRLLQKKLDGVAFKLCFIASVGDGDRTTDLRESPADFFTRELDEALLAGEIDLAIHSAKDVPDPLPDGLRILYLPWREDPRDVWVLASGKTLADLSKNPVVGVSSDRRAEYAESCFPQACLKPIRGNIEERLEQLDRGDFDLLLMAGAALLRLGLADRITEWIPLRNLPVPAGQGILALTFRANNKRLDFLWSTFPLAGRKILLTCSETLLERATELVLKRGGLPIRFPLIQTVPRDLSLPPLSEYDWIILTSPSAVRCFLEKAQPLSDALPRILSCGTGTAHELQKAGLQPEPLPKEIPFGTESVLQQAREKIKPNERVLRLRSQKADTTLAEQLQKITPHVTDLVLYDTLPVESASLPAFDVALFASPSAAQTFFQHHGIAPLRSKPIVAIGPPTFRALNELGLSQVQIPSEATLESAVAHLEKTRFNL